MPRIPAGGIQVSRLPEGRVGERGAKTSVELPGSSAVRVDTGRGGGDPTALGRALAQVGGDISQAAGTLAQIHQRNKREELVRQFTDKKAQFWSATREARVAGRTARGTEATGLIEGYKARADAALEKIEWDQVDSKDLQKLLAQFKVSEYNQEHDHHAVIMLNEKEKLAEASREALQGELLNKVMEPGTILDDVFTSINEISKADELDITLTPETRAAKRLSNGNVVIQAYFENLVNVGSPERALAEYDNETNKERLRDAMNIDGFNRLAGSAERIRASLGAKRKIVEQEAKDAAKLIESEATTLILDNINAKISDAAINGTSLGDATVALRGLLGEGKISSPRFLSYQSRIRTVTNDRTKFANGVKLVTDAVNNGQILDAKIHRKAINDYWEVNSVDIGSPQYVSNLVNFVKQTGIVPDAVKASVGATFKSANDDIVWTGVKVFKALRSDPTAVHALSQFSHNDKAFALGVATLENIAMPLSLAIQSQRDIVGMTDPQKEAFVKAATSARSREFNLKALDKIIESDEFDKGIFSTPEASQLMIASFNELFEAYLPLTGGDKDQARALAGTDITNAFALSNLSGDGPRVVRYSPEQSYPNLAKGLVEILFKKEVGNKLKGAVLIADKQTEAEWPYASYLIGYENPKKDGVFDIWPERWFAGSLSPEQAAKVLQPIQSPGAPETAEAK